MSGFLVVPSSASLLSLDPLYVDLPYPSSRTPKHVRFPCPFASPELFASSHETWSRAEYDRTPIEPPSEEERSCKLPGRGERCLDPEEELEDEHEEEEEEEPAQEDEQEETDRDALERREMFVGFFGMGEGLGMHAPTSSSEPARPSPATPLPTRRPSSSDPSSPTTARRMQWLQSQAESLPCALKARLLALSGVCGFQESSSSGEAEPFEDDTDDTEEEEEEVSDLQPYRSFAVSSPSPTYPTQLASPLAFHHPSSSLPLPTRCSSSSPSRPTSPTTTRRLLWLQSQSASLPVALRYRLEALSSLSDDERDFEEVDGLSPSRCLGFPALSDYSRPNANSSDIEETDDLSSTYEPDRPGSSLLLTSRALLASTSSSSISTLIQSQPSPRVYFDRVDSASSTDSISSSCSLTSSYADSADTSLDSLTSDEFGGALCLSPIELGPTGQPWKELSFERIGRVLGGAADV